MTTYTANPGYVQDPPYPQTMEARDAGFDPNRDAELFNLSGVVTTQVMRKKPFDWLVLAVLGCLCSPCIGPCAIYYAIRTNHGYDHNIEEHKIQDSRNKAQILTVLNLVLFAIALVLFIIKCINLQSMGVLGL